MKPKQLYFVLLAGVVLAGIGFVAVGYGANALLGSQASKLSKLKANSQVLSTEQSTLAKNKKDIAKYSQLNQAAEAIVPQDKDQAEAVREIVDLASSSGISQLTSITFPASTLGGALPGATNDSETTTNPALTQLIPVKGISGVYDLQITVTQDSSDYVTYGQFTDFLTKLEQNRRTAQVSSITILPDNTNPNKVAFTLVIDEFIKP